MSNLTSLETGERPVTKLAPLFGFAGFVPANALKAAGVRVYSAEFWGLTVDGDGTAGVSGGNRVSTRAVDGGEQGLSDLQSVRRSSSQRSVANVNPKPPLFLFLFILRLLVHFGHW